jgi:glutamate synthase (NADPH/NADH) large chain
MFLVDTAAGRIIEDDEVKAALAAEHPYQDWLDAGIAQLDDLPDRPHVRYPHGDVVRRQLRLRLHHEDQKILMAPMAQTGGEALGSMGTDTPIAVLSDRPRLLFDYFAQLFAQVTNPPLDAIREELVTSLGGTIGPERNLLAPGPESCRQIQLPFPILDNDQLAKLLHVAEATDDFEAVAIRGLYPVAEGGAGAQGGARRVRRQASEAIADGANVIILSDRKASRELAPIPSLLLTAAVHHHLVREKTRTSVGLVVEAGDAREVHHMALLIGYGAGRHQPVPGLRDRRGHDRPGRAGRRGARQGGEELHQGRRQGRAQGDVQDGHLHRRVLHRRPDLRGRRPRPGPRRRVLHRHHLLGGIGLDEIAAEVAASRAGPTPTAPERAHRELEVAASTSGAARASTTSSTPRRSSSSSTPRARAATTSSRSTRAWSTTSRATWPPCAACSSSSRGRPQPVPIDEVEPVSRDREALLHRRDELRLDLGRGARDAGHRHEPPRRQVQHRRGRRGPRALHADCQRRLASAPSSRWPRGASASPAST